MKIVRNEGAFARGVRESLTLRPFRVIMARIWKSFRG